MGIQVRVSLTCLIAMANFFFSYYGDRRQLTRNLGIPLSGIQNEVFIGHRNQNCSWPLSSPLGAHSSLLQLPPIVQTIKITNI